MNLEKHNEKIREFTNEMYKKEIKRSLLFDERSESFQIKKEKNIIVAVRKIDNDIEKYTLDIDKEELNGEFFVKIDNCLAFSGNYKNNELCGSQKLLDKGKIIWEVAMEAGKIKVENILENNNLKEIEIKKFRKLEKERF